MDTYILAAVFSKKVWGHTTWHTGLNASAFKDRLKLLWPLNSRRFGEGISEITEWLRVHTALAQDLALTASIQVGLFMATLISSSRGIQRLGSAGTHLHSHAHAPINVILKISIKTDVGKRGNGWWDNALGRRLLHEDVAEQAAETGVECSRTGG